MKKELMIRSLKEASACIKGFEAESSVLKEKVAKVDKENNDLKKEAEALKIAMELVLDESTLAEVNEKFATIKSKDLAVVREAMDLDLTKKVASMGEVYSGAGKSGIDMNDPLQAFYSVLAGNK